MYFLIDPTTNRVLSAALIDKDDAHTLEFIFPEAEENQVLAWFDSDAVPEHFVIDDNGDIQPLAKQQQVEQGIIQLDDDQEIEEDRIVTKSLEKQVKEGLIELKDTQKIVDNQIVEMSLQEQIDKNLLTLESPYQYLDGNEIKLWSIEQVLTQQLAKTQADAKILDADLRRMVEKTIAEKYSAGYELKLTKDFSLWAAEGCPADDARQQKFLAMQQEVDAIKASFAEQKTQIANLLATLPSDV